MLEVIIAFLVIWHYHTGIWLRQYVHLYTVPVFDCSCSELSLHKQKREEIRTYVRTGLNYCLTLSYDLAMQSYRISMLILNVSFMDVQFARWAWYFSIKYMFSQIFVLSQYFWSMNKQTISSFEKFNINKQNIYSHIQTFGFRSNKCNIKFLKILNMENNDIFINQPKFIRRKLFDKKIMSEQFVSVYRTLWTESCIFLI